MALSPFDHNDLVLTLFENRNPAAPWDMFLRRLLARTGAERIRIDVDDSLALPVRATAERGKFPLADEERSAIGALSIEALRANRVYALEELLDFDNQDRRHEQDALLAKAGIGDARFMLAADGGGPSVRLVLLHSRRAFGAEDSALMTSLAPALRIFAANQFAATRDRLRMDAAEAALDRAGIALAVLDDKGQAITGSAGWSKTAPPPSPGLIEACREATRLNAPIALPPGTSNDQAVLVWPLPGTGKFVTARRHERVADPIDLAPLLARELSLTPREAALAACLAAGRSLVEAAHELNLTEETARNYSKRIFAKTGTTGQADLVRRSFGGLAPLI